MAVWKDPQKISIFSSMKPVHILLYMARDTEDEIQLRTVR